MYSSNEYFVRVRTAKYSYGRRMSTRQKVLLPTRWVCAEMYSYWRRAPSADDHPANDLRQDEPTKSDAVRSGRSTKVRCEKTGETAIWGGRSMTMPPGINANFDDDIGLGGFKLAQIVHFDVTTSCWSTERTNAASDVERCRRLSILLGQIH